MYWKALLLVLPLLLLGGRSAHKPEWLHILKPIDAIGFTLASHTHIAPCQGRVSAKSIAGTGDTARHACYPSATHDLQLTRFGIVVTQQLNAGDPDFTEDCEIALEANDDGTAATFATTIASSVIQVGEGNADGTNCGATLDTIGEFCMLDLDQTDTETLVNAGGWFTIHIADGDGDPAASCDALQGVQAVVWGYFK